MRTALRASLLLLLLLLGADLLAAEPTLRGVNLRGLQVGGTTTLVVDGDDLGKEPRLLLPFAAMVTLKPGSTDKQATFDITPEGSVTPGYHHLRLATDGGVSLPTLLAVDAMPQKVFGPKVESLPVALHGTASGSVPIETKFTGKKGEKIRIEIEAQRLGSKLRPVVHLIGPSRREIAWAWPKPALGGDTRLDATLPDDGEYTVTLHDTEYAGANPGFFRMRIGDWSSVDQVYPPIIGKEAKSVELLTSTGLTKRDVVAPPGATVVPLAWPEKGTWSGARPFVRISDRPEVLEQADSTMGQALPEGAVGVSGKLAVPFEEDRYRLTVKAGQKLRFEVQAERIGSPVDVVLVVRNPAGAEVARFEDGPATLDSIGEYTVPANVVSLLVCVVDSQGRGGPAGIYRLSITPLPIKKAEPSLLTTVQRASIPAQGSAVIHVGIDRGEYAGAVTLSAAGLPAGVTIENALIPAEAEGTLLTLRASEGSAPTITAWRGKTDDGDERPLGVKGHPLERLQPWLATEIAIAPGREKSPFGIDWRNLPPGAGLSPAGKLTLPFKLTRPTGPLTEKSPVRVTLMTSQLGPLATPARDPNTQLRLEKAIELPPATVDGEGVVLVPPAMIGTVVDVTLKAELLSADKARVLATAFAPVRRMPVNLPLVVLSDVPKVMAKIDPKAATIVEIKGTLKRLDGATGDVQLTLTNLPPGVPAVPVTTVKADASTFAIKVTIPPTTVLGETVLKLVGTIVPDSKQPNVRVKSREVELALVVQ